MTRTSLGHLETTLENMELELDITLENIELNLDDILEKMELDRPGQRSGENGARQIETTYWKKWS